MTFLMQQTLQAGEPTNTCCWSSDINWATLAVLLQVLTLAYVAYGFLRTTRNQTRIEEYLKRLTGSDEK